jgi:hypothetical protein
MQEKKVNKYKNELAEFRAHQETQPLVCFAFLLGACSLFEQYAYLNLLCLHCISRSFKLH